MAVPLSPDYDAGSLRVAARMSKDAGQTRRLLALAAIYDGATRTEAVAMGNVTLQIIRDWVLKLNAQGPEALVDHKPPGPQPILSDAHRAALAARRLPSTAWCAGAWWIWCSGCGTRSR